MIDDNGWRIDKTINIPSIFSIIMVAMAGMFWLANLQFHTDTNTTAINEWKVTWSDFIQHREVIIRDNEHRLTMQEQVNREIISRLNSIEQSLRRPPFQGEGGR